jgi:hypothetical protein
MVFIGLASYLVVKLSMWLMEGKVANHHNFRKEDRDWILLIVLLVTSIITLIIWTITYIRLKEKEV